MPSQNSSGIQGTGKKDVNETGTDMDYRGCRLWTEVREYDPEEPGVFEQDKYLA